MSGGHTMGAVIDNVRQGSIAWEAGIRAGDELLSINGQPVPDILTYRFYIADPEVELHIRKAGGKEFILEIEKDYDEDVGLEFTGAVFDGTRRCRNRCRFCFVDQMPPGMRSTLYVKDDDFRLSFLYGNFITLTNLDGRDWETIRRLRLSPLYISVHATDPGVRRRLLGNPAAGAIREQLQRLATWGIQYHCQIVLCPGINDGAVLVQTIEDLRALWPAARSVAIVPVGLTRFRQKLALLRGVEPRLARELIRQVDEWQEKFLSEISTRFIWLSDEFYFLAEENIPAYETYEDFPQLENGVGLSAIFWQEFDDATRILPEALSTRRRVAVATGKLGAQVLKRPIATLNRIDNLHIDIYVISNHYFGPRITVSGLLTATDLVAALQDKDLGQELLLPAACLQDGTRFLDDRDIDEVSKQLKVPIIPVAGARELVERVTRT